MERVYGLKWYIVVKSGGKGRKREKE